MNHEPDRSENKTNNDRSPVIQYSVGRSDGEEEERKDHKRGGQIDGEQERKRWRGGGTMKKSPYISRRRYCIDLCSLLVLTHNCEPKSKSPLTRDMPIV